MGNETLYGVALDKDRNRPAFKRLINIQEIRINSSFWRNRWLLRTWYVLETYMLFNRCSEKQNLLEIARTAVSCSKRQ